VDFTSRAAARKRRNAKRRSLRVRRMSAPRSRTIRSIRSAPCTRRARRRPRRPAGVRTEGAAGAVRFAAVREIMVTTNHLSRQRGEDAPGADQEFRHRRRFRLAALLVCAYFGSGYCGSPRFTTKHQPCWPVFLQKARRFSISIRRLMSCRRSWKAAAVRRPYAAFHGIGCTMETAS